VQAAPVLPPQHQRMTNVETVWKSCTAAADYQTLSTGAVCTLEWQTGVCPAVISFIIMYLFCNKIYNQWDKVVNIVLGIHTMEVLR